MFVKPSMTKTAVKLLCLALFASLMIGSVCFADDDDEEDGLPKKAYSLGQERPKPKPKTKIIIREKIVIQCPPGSNWNADVKRCQNEDGEDIAPAPKAKKAQTKPRVEDGEAPAPRNQTPQATESGPVIPSPNFTFPTNRLRVKFKQCQWAGDHVNCSMTVVNTGDTATNAWCGMAKVVVDTGLDYKDPETSCSYMSPGSGGNLRFEFKFVDKNATTIKSLDTTTTVRLITE